jgi:hypothetical protein
MLQLNLFGVCKIDPVKCEDSLSSGREFDRRPPEYKSKHYHLSKLCLIERYQCFGGNWRLHLEGRGEKTEGLGSQKRWYLPTKLHDVISPKTVSFTIVQVGINGDTTHFRVG